MSNPEVVIIGGGLSGLCCARRLHEAGVSFQLLEASDDVGGRARTDEVNGFLLDRGFQVLLTAYPEARDVLDYDALNLARFAPGALVRYRGKFHRFADPWRSPRHLFSTAVSPIGSLTDKLRVARLRSRVCRGSLDKLFGRLETTTIDSLRQAGFSERIIEPFFRPFLGGVFLDPELETSSRMFEFVFRMFATGNAVLPAGGMREIARQIANQLPDGTLRTGASVETFERTTVRLTSGEVLQAGAVVVACEAPVAAKLLGDSKPPSGRGVTCLYFAAERPPIKEPILVLNGDGAGLINNLCVPSQVTPTYAPASQALVSVTVLGLPDANVEASVRKQLQDWFGPDVIAWRHLRTYRIPYALPSQAPPALSPVEKPGACGDHLFVCGDYLDTASIQGAMVSGRRAAECVLQRL
ncbi:MAG: protoporphyrinogen/coproporphyrinogen oxidase, partial [Pirellulales bacterium]